MELEDYRKLIEQIDEKLLSLLEERFLLSKAIGKIKKENNLPIEDLNREKNLLALDLAKIKNDDFIESCKVILLAILNESKKIQK